MTFFDTHMHIPEEPSGYETLIRDAAAANVKYLLACGGNLADCVNVQQFAELSPDVFFAAGIQPHDAENFTGSAEDFRKFAEDPAFIAVGEIGIDTYYDFNSLNRQIEVFRTMLKLALDFDVPAVVHCRAANGSEDAYTICYDELKQYSAAGGRFEMHCYAGTPEYLKRFADLGAFFGVGGMVTFARAENIRAAVMQMPLDRILLETDSPYLAPVPHRGEQNRPALIPLIAAKLAELRGITMEQAAELTTANAFRLFKRIKHV